MLQSSALREFYKDLTNEDYQTGLVVYHRRYSTNTSPRWPLAQPMRVLGHNGRVLSPRVFQWLCVALAVSRIHLHCDVTCLLEVSQDLWQ